MSCHSLLSRLLHSLCRTLACLLLLLSQNFGSSAQRLSSYSLVLCRFLLAVSLLLSQSALGHTLCLIRRLYSIHRHNESYHCYPISLQHASLSLDSVLCLCCNRCIPLYMSPLDCLSLYRFLSRLRVWLPLLQILSYICL